MAKANRAQQKQPEMDMGETIILAGRPTALRGEVYLRNDSEDRVRVQRLPLAIAPPTLKEIPSRRAALTPTVRISPGILRAGHAGHVGLSASLDPHTPPGEYQAQVEIAGKLHPVTMLVIEMLALRVAPSFLVIENRPDQVIRKSVVISNLGNVALTIGKLGAVYLDDELLICRTLRHAASSVGDELRPLDEYLARILLSAKQVAESSGILRVYSEETIVQPGEIRTVELEIRVPSTLDRRGRYRGVIPIYTSSLGFVIVPTTGPNIPDEEPAPKPRPRKGSTD